MSEGLTFSIDARDGASPAVQSILDGLSDRSGMHEAIGEEVRTLVRDYLTNVTGARHDTAERLGATPSGHWSQAAETLDMTADDEAATVSIHDPAAGRALHDVTITPGPGKKFLTIPAIAEAYNQRAYQIPGLVAITSGDKGVLMMPNRASDGDRTLYASRKYKTDKSYSSQIIEGSQRGTVWYYLVSSVTQIQDRTLLPSDQALLQAAMQGARNYLDYLLFRGSQQEGGAS